MEVLDIILIVIIVLTVWSGIKQGLIRAAGSLFGLIAGFFIAAGLTQWFVNQWEGFSAIWYQVIIFFVAFSIVSAVIGIVVDILDKFFNFLGIIPLLKSSNKILGGVFGLLEAAIGIMALRFVGQVILNEGAIQEAILTSRVVNWFAWSTDLIGWILSVIGKNYGF